MNSEIGSALVAWFGAHKRDLPWRYNSGRYDSGRDDSEDSGASLPDAYRVWVSEIMLQQTTVAGVKPYFTRFMERFPTIEALASAPQEAVLDMWAGLGYYARARNLHACARRVVDEFGGKFPAHEKILRSLPGIGDYTAGAIMAIAFSRPAIVIDGNVKRVLARLLAAEEPLSQIDKRLRSYYADIFYDLAPSCFAQAMMELGALICTPLSPRCMACPVERFCLGKERWRDIPHRTEKKALPIRYGVLLYIGDDSGRVLLRRRVARSMLGGCAEFIGSAWDNKACESDIDLWRSDLRGLLRRLGARQSALTDLEAKVFHSFTHYKLELRLARLLLSEASLTAAAESVENAFIVSAGDLETISFPSLMVKARQKFLAQT